MSMYLIVSTKHFVPGMWKFSVLIRRFGSWTRLADARNQISRSGMFHVEQFGSESGSFAAGANSFPRAAARLLRAGVGQNRTGLFHVETILEQSGDSMLEVGARRSWI